MKKTTIRIALLAAVLTLAVGSIALAGRWGGGYGGGPGYGPGGCPGWTGAQAAPQLTAEQQQAAEKLLQEYRETIIPLRELENAKQAELYALLSGKEVNSMKVEKLTKEINELRSDIFAKRIAFKQRYQKEVGVDYSAGYGRGYKRGYNAGNCGYANCPGAAGNCPGGCN